MDVQFAKWEMNQLEKHIVMELMLRAEFSKQIQGSQAARRAWKKKSDTRLEDMKSRLAHLEWALANKGSGA